MLVDVKCYLIFGPTFSYAKIVFHPSSVSELDIPILAGHKFINLSCEATVFQAEQSLLANLQCNLNPLTNTTPLQMRIHMQLDKASPYY